MNTTRTLRQIGWYPSASDFPASLCIGQGGIERFMAVATGGNELDQANAECRKKECSGGWPALSGIEKHSLTHEEADDTTLRLAQEYSSSFSS